MFYIDKQCSMFLYSMERDYCQHESINVGWKIVKFLLKNIAFDNIAFEDVFVLRAADKKTPAFWSVLSGKVLPARGKRCIRQVIVSGSGNWDRLRRRIAAPPRKHLLAGSSPWVLRAWGRDEAIEHSRLPSVVGSWNCVGRGMASGSSSTRQFTTVLWPSAPGHGCMWRSSFVADCNGLAEPSW